MSRTVSRQGQRSSRIDRATCLLMLLMIAGCSASMAPPMGIGHENTNANGNANNNVNVNANVDTNGNATNDNAPVPECQTDKDCTNDEVCENAACVPLPQLSLELGTMDTKSGVFVPAESGASVLIYAGFQGLTELFITMRVSNLSAFPIDMPAFDISETVTVVDTGVIIHEFTEGPIPFTSLSGDEAELSNRRLILDASSALLDGREVDVSISLTTDFEGRTTGTSLNRRWTLTLGV